MVFYCSVVMRVVGCRLNFIFILLNCIPRSLAQRQIESRSCCNLWQSSMELILFMIFISSASRMMCEYFKTLTTELTNMRKKKFILKLTQIIKQDFQNRMPY
uniref:Uncharacterized protein n=1 Tax=Cacopsylla melanoneura TaxID=428564 RepID=A0A8D8R639_9HEMI